MTLGKLVILILGAQLLKEDALQLLYVGRGQLLEMLNLAQCIVVAVLCQIVDYTLLVAGLDHLILATFHFGVGVFYVDDKLLAATLLLQQMNQSSQFPAHMLQCIQRECAPNERQYQSCRHTNKNGKQSHPSLEEQLRQGHSHYRDDARQPVGADGIGGGEKHVDANDHNQRRCQRRGKESDDLLPRHHPEQLAHQQINNADKQ